MGKTPMKGFEIGGSLGEALMPYSTLFGFSRVKNSLVKITPSGVKNNPDCQPNLHPPFLGLFSCRNCCFLVYFIH
jgi:hypothetical protein